VSETTEPAPDPLAEPIEIADDFAVDDPSLAHAIAHPSRRGWMLLASAFTTLSLLAVAFLLPVPFVKLAPGPTFNVIGEADGQPVIDITGAQTYPGTGNLDMTTVLESGGPRGGLTFVDAIASWLNPSDAVVPRELIFPDDVSGEEVQKHQAMLFSTSESDAVAAAMTYLDRPIISTVVVTAVVGDSPADGQLLPKDEILTVDGTKVTEPAQVASAVRSAPVGTTFELKVRRDGVDVDGTMKDNVEQSISVTSAANPDDPTVPYIGIGVGTFYSAGFPIDFTLTDVGGPSAGLMFATGIVDKLTPDNLTNGKHIAGTGTIDPDGTVGPIGGIRQKLAGARNAGAELFLMPKVHCTEAAGHIPDGLTVVPVGTLTDAVNAIHAFNEGKPVATCPAAVS
jgi:PDZ domain-containing protein